MTEGLIERGEYKIKLGLQNAPIVAEQLALFDMGGDAPVYEAPADAPSGILAPARTVPVSYTHLTEPYFRRLSTDAKLLYGLMLDRMSLSMRNGWMDDDGHVYIYFTLEEACEQHEFVESDFLFKHILSCQCVLSLFLS